MSRRHLTKRRIQDDSRTKIGAIRAGGEVDGKGRVAARSQMRERGGKIDTIIDFQINNEVRFAKLTEARPTLIIDLLN